MLYCSLTIMSADSAPEIELLTTAEVAELLKVSVSGVRRLQQARQLPFINVGGSVRFSRRDILSYLERRRVESIG
jgi:excisionase family DNA binding protein